MPKLRPQTIRRLHGLLADAATTWDQAGRPESLRRYTLAYGDTHLRATGDHERLWTLLQDEAYRRAQLEVFSQYEPSYRALKEGIDLYVERDGQTPEDDARLCWLALRAGELSEEAKGNIAEAFAWVRGDPLEDPTRIERAIERLSVLDEEGFFKAAVLMLWIEADRQAELPEEERMDVGARLVLEAVEARIPEGASLYWNEILSAEFMAWWALSVVKVLPGADLVKMIPKAIHADKYVEQFIIHIEKYEDTITIDQCWLVLFVADRVTHLHYAMALAAVAQALAETGRLDEALQFAQVIERGFWKSKALAAVARALAEVGRLDEAQRAFDEALQAARAIGDDKSRSRALAAVAQALAEAGRLDEALQFAQVIERGIWQSEALLAIAQAMVESGQLDEALKVARTVDYVLKSEALAFVARTLAEAGRLDEALQAARAIGDDKSRSRALAAVARALAEAGRLDEAHRAFDEAKRAAEAIESDWEKSEALVLVVKRLAEAGQLDGALQAARAIGDDKSRSRALAAVARALAEAGRLDEAHRAFLEAMQVAQTSLFDRDKVEALKSVVRGLAKTSALPLRQELFARALQIARTIESYQSEALAAVAQALAKVGQLDEAHYTFDEAKRVAVALKPDRSKAEALTAIARALTNAGRLSEARHTLDEVRQATQTIKDELDRDMVLADLVRAMVETEQFYQALGVSQDITRGSIRSSLLHFVIPKIANNKNAYMFHHFMTRIRISDSMWNIALERWREDISKYIESPRALLRASFRYHLFSSKNAYNGIHALQVAHLQGGHRPTFDAIIRQCPQLGLGFLLPENGSGDRSDNPSV